jgi:hypothetical protein
MTRAGALVAVASLALLAGCVTHDERPIVPIAAQKATSEIPQDELLDVGVHCSTRTFPRTRRNRRSARSTRMCKAESRYMPTLLRDTLEGTGQWGRCVCCPRR